MLSSRFRSLLLAFLITVTIFVVSAVAVGAPTLPVFFTENTESTGTSPEVTAMESELLNRLNSASTSIDVAIYDFNRDSIRDALIAAHQRGVIVRVITDDEAREHIASYIPYYAALESAGISIVDDNRAADIMHNKFIIIDKAYVWTGSTNMTDNGFNKNNNNTIFITNTQIAELYLNEFDQMFIDGQFSIHKDQLITTTFEHNGIPLEIHFSPEGDVMNKVINAVNLATDEINFAIFFFTDDPLRDALIAAHERGVRIKGVWDNLGASNAYSDDEALCEAGIPIKIENYLGKMHNKMMVIDPSGASPKVVTGSMNWTRAGGEDNDENTIIVHDGTTAQMFKANFDELYDSLPAEIACVEETIPEPEVASVYLPLIANLADGSVQPTPVATQTPVPTVTAEPTATPTLTPTPAPTATPTATADVQIVRIVYNPDGSDVEGELVELSNSGSAAVDMTDWVLQDEAGTRYTFGAFTLDPAASVTVWVKAGTDTISDLYWNRGSSVWNNGGDTATLLDGFGGNVIDSCTYIGGGIEASCTD